MLICIVRNPISVSSPSILNNVGYTDRNKRLMAISSCCWLCWPELNKTGQNAYNDHPFPGTESSLTSRERFVCLPKHLVNCSLHKQNRTIAGDITFRRKRIMIRRVYQLISFLPLLCTFPAFPPSCCLWAHDSIFHLGLKNLFNYSTLSGFLACKERFGFQEIRNEPKSSD